MRQRQATRSGRVGSVDRYRGSRYPIGNSLTLRRLSVRSRANHTRTGATYRPMQDEKVIEQEPGNDWRDLQVRVATILSECGFETESPRTLTTVRGRVEVDVYAVDPSTVPRTLYVCECKRWKVNVPQGEVFAFRTALGDIGAHHGLFISSVGFQQGAHEVVRNTNVTLLSWAEFQNLVCERWCREYWAPTFRREAAHLANRAMPPVGDAALVFEHGGRALTAAEVVGLIANDMWGPPFLAVPDFPASSESMAPAIWALREEYREHLPAEALATTHLRPFLDYLLAIARS